jgi:hypothetical protein
LDPTTKNCADPKSGNKNTFLCLPEVKARPGGGKRRNNRRKLSKNKNKKQKLRKTKRRRGKK